MKDDIFSTITATCASDRSAGRATQNKRRRGSYGTFVTLGFVMFGLMLAVFAATPARAEPPRTIADCEKIQAADAYNQCLASFGPAAHERNMTADPEGSGGRASDKAAAQTSSRRHGGHASRARGYHQSRHQASGHAKHADPWAHMRHPAGGGRKRAEFKVRHHR